MIEKKTEWERKTKMEKAVIFQMRATKRPRDEETYGGRGV